MYNAIHLTPFKGPISAQVQIPGSKSETNRALILAALTQGAVSLRHPLVSEDTWAMAHCLQTLGVEIQMDPEEWIVKGDLFSIEEKNYSLFAYDSGTTARFLLALLCIVPGTKILQGNPRLNERPIHDLVLALRQLGAGITYIEKEGALPVRIETSSLSGTDVFVKGDMSSQFCSALLMISPLLAKGLKIHVVGELISKPYVEMTIGCMQNWGVRVLRQEETYWIPAGQTYQKQQTLIEGDYSSAAYFFAIAALTQSRIGVSPLNPISKQADRQFLQILQKMGHRVTIEEERVYVEGKTLTALDVDMLDCPDQVMTMAVLAAFAKGVSHISGIRSLRVKETDRVAALRTELKKMGIETEDTSDTLTIHGGFPQGAAIDTYNDHRIAMAFAVAGMSLPHMTIRRPEVVNKTFPRFWETLARLTCK